jgi:phosphoribosylamine---glycine ligase
MLLHRPLSQTRQAIMNILLLGSGGREHALAWKIAASPLADRLYCAPGNAGIAREAECTALDLADHGAIVAFCKAKAIDLVVVGPEAPLVAGAVDDIEAAGIKAFGPTRAAARLEGSKGFTKDLCRANNIPTADYWRFYDAQSAKDHVRRMGVPIVVKADGLAAGKGVVVAATQAEAEQALDAIFGGAGNATGERIGSTPHAGARARAGGDASPFPPRPAEERAGAGSATAAAAANPTVVIEEFLAGEEASFLVLTDGDNVVPLATAEDHKRAFDGDRGPNTGGMGACSPASVMTPHLESRALDEIVMPTLRAMKAMGTPYKGVLYAGLMITEQGPKLIEYNVRFGDPECQVLMLRLMSDLLPALVAARDGVLKNFALRWYQQAALAVVMATKGYPGPYARGSAIGNLDAAAAIEDVEIFHAGTRAENGRILADGGRVLNICALGASMREAQKRAYAAVDKVVWPEGFCRRDIGSRAVARERQSAR